MGGASTGPRKWMPLSFACNSGNGEGMDMERWAGGFSNEERRAGGWPGFRKGVVPAGNGKQETPYGDESVRG